MGRFDNPLVAAAKREMEAIYRETGGKHDPMNPNRDPAYVAALRMFHAILDAEDGVWCQRYDVRQGKRPLQIVK